MYRVLPEKANEWPLMSTPINKAMLIKVAENGNEIVRKSKIRSSYWLYLECSLITPRVVSDLASFFPSWIRRISFSFFWSSFHPFYSAVLTPNSPLYSCFSSKPPLALLFLVQRHLPPNHHHAEVAVSLVRRPVQFAHLWKSFPTSLCSNGVSPFYPFSLKDQSLPMW